MDIGALGYRLLVRLDPKFFERFRNQVAECCFADPQLTAKFFPYEARSRSYIVPKSPRGNHDVGTTLPIPPKRLWYGYAKTPEGYLASGQRRVERMREILETTGFKIKPGQRILDFGCASGIMLRWFLDLAGTGEAWGVDIFSEATVWGQQHLSPPFKLVTTTSFPHLPFEDRYFDCIYACSVFTHIADLAEAWLLELKRVVRPGGRLFITVHDNETIRSILDEIEDPQSPDLVARSKPLRDALRLFDEETRFQTAGFAMFSLNRTPGPGAPGQAQVFYDRDYLRQHWGNYLKVITTVPRWVAGVRHTAVVLEK